MVRAVSFPMMIVSSDTLQDVYATGLLLEGEESHLVTMPHYPELSL